MACIMFWLLQVRDALAALKSGGPDVEVCIANLESAAAQVQALLLMGMIKPEPLTPAERAAASVAAAGERGGFEAARAEAVQQEALWQEYKQLARQQLQRPVSGPVKDLKEQLAITATSIASLKDQLQQLQSMVVGAVELLTAPDQSAAAVDDARKEVAQGVEQLLEEVGQGLEADAPPRKRQRVEQAAEAGSGAAAGSTAGTGEGRGGEEEGVKDMLGEKHVGGGSKEGGAGALQGAEGEEGWDEEPELVEVRRKKIFTTSLRIVIKVYELDGVRLKGLMVETLSEEEVKKRKLKKERERERGRPARMSIPVVRDWSVTVSHRSWALAAAKYLDFCGVFAQNLYKLTFSNEAVPGLFGSAMFDPTLASHPLVVGSRNGRLPALRCIRCCDSPWGVWLVLAGGLHGAWPQLQQLHFEGGDWDSFSTECLQDELQDKLSGYGSVVAKGRPSGRSGSDNPGARPAGAASAGIAQLSQLEMLIELGVRGAWPGLWKLVFQDWQLPGQFRMLSREWMRRVQAPGPWPRLRQLSFIRCQGDQDAAAAVKSLQNAGFWLQLGDKGVDATKEGLEEVSIIDSDDGSSSQDYSINGSDSEQEEVDSYLCEHASDVTGDDSGNEGEGSKEGLDSEGEAADGELEMEVQQ